jgi:hypothetical protein
MKRILTLLIIVANVSTNHAQRSIEDVIVGRWKTIEVNGDTLIFNFDKNMTMYMSSIKGDIGRGEVLKNGQKVKSLMKYELNVRENPYQFNFINFIDNFYTPVDKAEGIIEMLNENTLRMAMNFNKNLSRPSNFENKSQTRILFRAQTKIDVEDCQRFKDGKFKINDPILGEVIIERQGDFQEQTNANGDKSRFKVNWTGPCGYELAPIKTFTKNTWTNDTTGLVASVEILHTKKKSYLYLLSYNKSKFKFFGELIKIK